jgi:hypothetical protein
VTPQQVFNLRCGHQHQTSRLRALAVSGSWATGYACSTGFRNDTYLDAPRSGPCPVNPGALIALSSRAQIVQAAFYVVSTAPSVCTLWLGAAAGRRGAQSLPRRR